MSDERRTDLCLVNIPHPNRLFSLPRRGNSCHLDAPLVSVPNVPLGRSTPCFTWVAHMIAHIIILYKSHVHSLLIHTHTKYTYRGVDSTLHSTLGPLP